MSQENFKNSQESDNEVMEVTLKKGDDMYTAHLDKVMSTHEALANKAQETDAAVSSEQQNIARKGIEDMAKDSSVDRAAAEQSRLEKVKALEAEKAFMVKLQGATREVLRVIVEDLTAKAEAAKNGGFLKKIFGASAEDYLQAAGRVMNVYNSPKIVSTDFDNILKTKNFAAGLSNINMKDVEASFAQKLTPEEIQKMKGRTRGSSSGMNSGAAGA